MPVKNSFSLQGISDVGLNKFTLFSGNGRTKSFNDYICPPLDAIELVTADFGTFSKRRMLTDF